MKYIIKNQPRLLAVFGIALVSVSAGLFVVFAYFSKSDRNIPMIFSDYAMLAETWNEYKNTNIEPASGRTIDTAQGSVTTSEGESYTMLRAVWMDDKATFDRSWQFTRNNLQRPDHLFSWRFGSRADGTYGILTDQGGENSAADADTDIALSLMMAYHRWNDGGYLYVAKQIINNIWDQEVVLVQGKPVLTADNLEKNAKTIVVNPSYFSPYSYKLFALVDKTHDWTSLADNSYTLLSRLSADPLGGAGSDGLPPDWITINRTTGALLPNNAPSLDTHYSYDAFRTSWRLALDYQWFKDPRDAAILSKFSFLATQWRAHHRLDPDYTHDGTPLGNYEAPAVYGAAMGYFSVIDPTDAQSVYREKLLTLYSPDIQEWAHPLSYYDDNWAWFGLALYQNRLPNIAEAQP